MTTPIWYRDPFLIRRTTFSLNWKKLWYFSIRFSHQCSPQMSEIFFCFCWTFFFCFLFLLAPFFYFCQTAIFLFLLLSVFAGEHCSVSSNCVVQWIRIELSPRAGPRSDPILILSCPSTGQRYDQFRAKYRFIKDFVTVFLGRSWLLPLFFHFLRIEFEI